MIRTLDHTADVGFELEAPSLEELFEEARRGLLLVMFERPPDRGGERETVRLSAPDLEMLLVRWINELAYLVQARGLVPTGSEPEIREDGGSFVLEAHLAGTELDPEVQGWQGEVKSATFHGLEVKRENGTWSARVILDV